MNAYTKCETWMCVQIFVLSSQHNSGEQLDQYTGVAAILRFPIYDDDEEEDSSTRDASTTCSAPDGSAARSKKNRSSMQHHSSVKNGNGIMGTTSFSSSHSSSKSSLRFIYWLIMIFASYSTSRSSSAQAPVHCNRAQSQPTRCTSVGQQSQRHERGDLSRAACRWPSCLPLDSRIDSRSMLCARLLPPCARID